jgi:hypothetical protein
MRIIEDVIRELVAALELPFASRIFLMRAPQAPAPSPAVPYCVMIPAGTNPIHGTHARSYLMNRVFQFSIYDSSQTRALWVSETLRLKIDALRGHFGGVNFGAILLRAQTAAAPEIATGLFHVISDYEFIYSFCPEPSAAQVIASYAGG